MNSLPFLTRAAKSTTCARAAEKATLYRLLHYILGDVYLPPPPKRLRIEDAQWMMLGRLPPPPSSATLRIKPAPALAVAPRRIVRARVTLHALERRHRELDLPERIDPRDDEAAIGDDGDAGLPKSMREPARELVPRFAVERPRARQGAAQPKAGDHTWIPFVSPAR